MKSNNITKKNYRYIHDGYMFSYSPKAYDKQSGRHNEFHPDHGITRWAIDSGHKEMVEALIREAPLVHIGRKSNALDLSLLLNYAIAFGTTAIVKALLDTGQPKPDI